MKVGAANAAIFADVVADGIDITTSNVTVQNISIQAARSAVATGNYNYGVYLHNSTSAVLTHGHHQSHHRDRLQLFRPLHARVEYKCD